jgi:hypothetical protein
MPCIDLKWNFTQKRLGRVDEAIGVAAEAVHLPVVLGRPRSENRMVTWCRLSGDSDQKSHIAVALRRLVWDRVSACG